MDYEKKYLNALEWARQVKDGKTGFIRDEVLDVFPELKDNDEMIKREIIKYIKTGTYHKDWIEWLEKQGEKPQGKSALEAWKDMRFEVYAQASGNKHEPNDSDDTTKMFSLNDIDEIIEKINEQNVDNANKVKPKFKVGDTIKEKSTGDIVTISEVDLKNREYRLSNTGFIPFKYEYLWELVEQKSANKVSPKFHEGEWVVWENQYYKVNYNGCGYELVGQNGLNTSLEYGTVDENAHHWDIAKDAKEGDVLVSDNIVFIFNKIHDVWINCHCSLFKDDSFYGGDFDLMHIRYGKEVFPATKEQRDTLLKAMADAGWQFDFDKKELKKIEQKPAWSEEDEKIALSIEQVMNCASLLNLVPEKIERVRAWLKSLKERIIQVE